MSLGRHGSKSPASPIRPAAMGSSTLTAPMIIFPSRLLRRPSNCGGPRCASYPLRLKPAVTYGMPIGSGESGYYFDYSGDAKLLFGTTVKLFGEAAYINRAGTYTRDQDAANALPGDFHPATASPRTPVLPTVPPASAAGSTSRPARRRTGYIELGAFKETTTLSSGKSPINSNVPISPMVYKATFVIGKFYLEGCYSPNYPLDGTELYNLDSQGAAQKSFLEIKVGAIFNL